MRKTLALDFDAAEIRFLREPQNDPERRFNRGWALCVLSTVIARLRVEYCAWSRRSGAATAPGDRFDKLKVFLPGPELEEPAYRAVAVALETTANAIKRRVFQLRERFGELLREHLAELVGSDEEVESELRFLYEALELPASCYELHRQ